MRIWMRFLREKRLTIGMYLLMTGLFLAVGSLYHIENLEKMFYAAILVLFLGGIVGIFQGIRYVAKSRQLEETVKEFQGSGELFLGEISGQDITSCEKVQDCQTLEAVYAYLIYLAREKARRAREEWEEQTVEHNDYYVMWTHQIKVPISAMKLLLEGGNGQDRSFLMREELFKIDQYVEMVLGFQRLESLAEDLVLGPCQLDAMCRQVAKKFSVLFINKGLALDLQTSGAEVITDEKWFIFCMEQILSNSIKYTRRGSIHIHGQKKEDQVLLYVEDTGIGIHKEDLPRIFERGFTGYNGRLDKKSTGIGLYLCRRVFDHLGIGMEVKSQVGEGTQVILTMVGRDCFPGNKG